MCTSFVQLEAWQYFAQIATVWPDIRAEQPAACHLQPGSLDTAFQRRIRFELQFAMPPPALRAKLWRLMLPKQVYHVLTNQ